MPEINELPPSESSFPNNDNPPSRGPMLSFADLIVENSLLPVNVWIVQKDSTAKEFLTNELLTALQCEV